VARARAESAERRATILSESSAILSSSLDPSTTLRTVSQLVVPRFADWCIVDLVTRENTLERVAVSASGVDSDALLAELQRYTPDWASAQPSAESDPVPEDGRDPGGDRGNAPLDRRATIGTWRSCVDSIHTRRSPFR